MPSSLTASWRAAQHYIAGLFVALLLFHSFTATYRTGLPHTGNGWLAASIECPSNNIHNSPIAGRPQFITYVLKLTGNCMGSFIEVPQSVSSECDFQSFDDCGRDQFGIGTDIYCD